MSATPTNIPIGTVASRIRAFQSNTELSRNVLSPPSSPKIRNNTPSIHNNETYQPDFIRQKQVDEPSSTSGVPFWLQPSRFPAHSLTAAKESHHERGTASHRTPFSTDLPSRGPSISALATASVAAPHENCLATVAVDMDGVSDLSTVRSQLKCIEASDDSSPHTPAPEVGVLGELDSMIQAAINAQDREHRRIKSESELQDSSTCTDTNMTGSSATSPRLRTLQLDQNDTSELLPAIGGPRHRPRIRSESLKKLPQVSYKDVPHHIWTLPHGKVAEMPGAHMPDAGDVTEAVLDEARRQRDRSSSMVDITLLESREVPVTARQARRFPRYHSWKVLHKDQTIKDRSGFNDASSRDNEIDVFKHAGKVEVPTSLTGGRPNSNYLIPLTLPKLVEQSRHQTTSSSRVSKEKNEREGNNETDLNDNRGTEDAVETKDISTALRSSAFNQSSESASTAPMLNNQSTPNSSVIQSKIRELLAATKQTRHDHAGLSQESNVNRTGRVKQSLLKENIRFGRELDSRTLPPYQSPINEQASLLKGDMGRSTPTQRTTLPRSNTLSSSSTPGTKLQRSNDFPSRYQSAHSRQPLSPRGPGYTFEQRFSVSPSRSHSRASQNAVRVSVELRRSPERQRPDDQLLLVRASVEPEEGDDLDLYR